MACAQTTPDDRSAIAEPAKLFLTELSQTHRPTREELKRRGTEWPHVWKTRRDGQLFRPLNVRSVTMIASVTEYMPSGADCQI